jgi:hypothetical protein
LGAKDTQRYFYVVNQNSEIITKKQQAVATLPIAGSMIIFLKKLLEVISKRVS